MKTYIAAGIAALTLGFGATAMAEDQAPAAAAAAKPAAVASALSAENTPIETIAADPAGKAALDKNIPGLTQHPAYDQFKAMSLRQVQPMSNGQLTDAQIAGVQADLDKIGK